MPTRAATQRKAIDREEQMIKWQSEGCTVSEMARRMGITRQRAGTLWARALERRPTVHLEQYRQSQKELIDAMKVRLLTIIDHPSWDSVSPRTRVEAGSVIIRLMEREAKLTGIDAVVRREITVMTEDTVDAAIRSLSGELALKAQEAGIALPELPR